MPLRAISSFDIPSHEPEEVRHITCIFKQICFIIEISILYVKLGTQSPLFLDAFEKQEAYMKQEPTAKVACPPWMWKGIHEHRTIGSKPEEFWSYVSDENLVKNFYDESELPTSIEKLIAAKIVDITSRGMECHGHLCTVFKEGVRLQFKAEESVLKQIEAVAFVAHFKEGDSKELQKHIDVINDKSQTIANSLLAFPYGRAVILSAQNKAKTKDATAGKQSTMIANFKLLVDEFPSATSGDMFSAISNDVIQLFNAVDKDDQPGKLAVINLCQPSLAEIELKVAVIYKNEVTPVLRQLVVKEDIDFNDVLSDGKLQDRITWIADTLPLLNAAQTKLDGFLLPGTYCNQRTIAKDLKGLLVTALKAQEAVVGEYLNGTITSAMLDVVTSLDIDKFRDGIGVSDGIDWSKFIEKVQKSDVVAKCRNFMMKDVEPSAALVKDSMTKISNNTLTSATDQATPNFANPNWPAPIFYLLDLFDGFDYKSYSATTPSM